jgi:hypothetical protein
MLAADGDDLSVEDQIAACAGLARTFLEMGEIVVPRRKDPQRGTRQQALEHCERLLQCGGGSKTHGWVTTRTNSPMQNTGNAHAAPCPPPSAQAKHTPAMQRKRLTVGVDQ